MTDASWDNSGMPPRKKGMPLWVKLLGGCGIVLVLILATCIGGGILLVKKGGQAMQALTASQWSELRAAVDQMQTRDGAKAFYAAHPRLADQYPTEDAFLEAWSGWSSALTPLPAEPPALTSGRYSPSYQNNNGFKRVTITYTTETGHAIHAQWEDGELVSFRAR